MRNPDSESPSARRVGRTPGPRGAGFTLLEMLVVIAVLALVVGLVVARGPMRSASLDVRAAASEIAQGLRLARGAAIASNAPTSIAVDAAARAWRISGAAARRLPDGIAVAATPPVIGFSPDGSSTGGRILLAAGTRRVAVVVAWLTGRVSVADAP